MAPTKTTPKRSKPVDNDIHPLTPVQTHEPTSIPPSSLGSASLPLSGSLRRRSLRLASVSSFDFPQCPVTGDPTGTGIRVLKDPNAELTEDAPGSDTAEAKAKGREKRRGKSVELNGSECEGGERGKGFLNLRSGKKVLKRGTGVGQDDIVENRLSSHDNFETNGGSAKHSRKTKKGEGEGNGELGNMVKLGFEFDTRNAAEGGKFVDSEAPEESDKRGKRKLDGSGKQGDVTGNAEEGSSLGDNGSARRKRYSREEKGKEVAVDGGLSSNVVPESELDVESEMKNSDAKHSGDDVAALQDQRRLRNTNRREHGSRRMDRFRDIARENASRFAHFAQEEDNEDRSSREPEEEHEVEDWPGPFSTAMKIIKDREMKSIQTGCVSSERSLVESIKWVPKTNQGHIGDRFSVPSLQELCLNVLAKNVDAIVSLDGVPDALRHRLSQLLCDSRRINGHFFDLLVAGSPTEIRLRDCSWLTEEQLTKSFQMCDTANLLVLQLDQCGRCLPDYVIVATLAQSPKQLPRLTSLSLSGACRLSDGGLRTLVSSAPALRSINLSQCSLFTSSSIDILAKSLKSVLKELYLDDCQGIDAALIVPALIELEHLEVLSVAGIQTLCDEFVEDFIIARGHNMKELVLKDCVNLTDASMKVIAEHCPGLCALDLMNLCKLTDLSIGYLTGCRALHTLKFCRNPFSDEAIAAFVETTGESLTELSLNNIKKVGYHTTLSLASHAKNLHALDLSWCRNLTDNALGLIVDSCLSLRLLKLFGCTQVTNVFLNGHSNLQIQIIGLKMSPVLQHVKVPDPHVL